MQADRAIPRPNYSIPHPATTMGYFLADWLANHAVVPDGDLSGEMFEPTIDHKIFLANHYIVRRDAQRGELASAFRYRRSAWVAAQKVGKSPGIAGHALIEFVGPSQFDGFAAGGEDYQCSAHRCPCGWEYEFMPGEPMGRPRATPRIQLAAVVEDQVENTWGALIPMIDFGPLANVIPKTGEEFIRHPNGNRDSLIEIVTSKADSKLGARISAAFPDETGLYTDSNKMRKFNRTLLRGLGGMGGRMVESSNPPDPAESSWLQKDTMESGLDDVYVHHFPPPKHLDFEKPAERMQIFRYNYQFSPWVDLRDIEKTAVDLMREHPGEAERFYGNRIVSGTAHWIKQTVWDLRAAEPRIEVRPRTKICLGFDGSETNDWTGFRAETLDFHQFTPRYHGGTRATIWDPRRWDGRIPRLEVDAALADILSEYDVVRAYFDPFGYRTELAEWSAKYGDVIVEFATNRLGQMWEALEAFKTTVIDPESGFTHDGDPTVSIHIRNAVESAVGGFGKYYIKKASEDQKIDLTMSSVLAHTATLDAVKSGAKNTKKTTLYTGTSTKWR
ncbi:hypothetical protein ACP6NG_09040 [Brevibacterium casei]|uniref:Terminase large subunit n=1 Tax=Brevibacterium casei TaxID=33889 RepID=A0A7T2TGS4_9MICO|nr:hypothetical protein [Brevibacterium casei]QPS33443.1 hypothetical protein I6G59_16165 [Brevibacterium casei]